MELTHWYDIAKNEDKEIRRPKANVLEAVVRLIKITIRLSIKD